MRPRLMYPDRDFDLEADLPPHAEDLTHDLELETLFAGMAGGDEFLREVARRAVLTAGLTDPAEIAYRQAVLRDCLAHPDVVRELYDLAVAGLVAERRAFMGMLSKAPSSILARSIEVLEEFVKVLHDLRSACDEHAAELRSEGLTNLCGVVAQELDDGWFEAVDDHLAALRFPHGALISARLGRGNRGTDYVLRRPPRRTWRDRLAFLERDSFSFQIAERDQAGLHTLTDLKGRGINLAANALAQSNDHILGFFQQLRAELGFYVGCLVLHDRLAGKGEPTCFGEPLPPGEPVLTASGLYDVGLSLTIKERTIGNDVNADGRSLVMITGANQGGKSTLLRGAGLAQLMLQAGMFVGAASFRADVRRGVFTHFRREEDATMRSGKLDEELGRMSGIVDAIGPDGLLLCNESFASTNEREGAQIAREVVGALRDAGVKVLYVTHMFDLAHGLHAAGDGRATFLRAERRDDGVRTFRLVPGEPLPTSHGEDVYRQIFGTAPADRVATDSTIHSAA